MYAGGTAITDGTLEFDGPAALSNSGILTITGTNSEVVLEDLAGEEGPSIAVGQPAVADAAADSASTDAAGSIGGISALWRGYAAARAADSFGAAASAASASPAAVPEPSTLALLGVRCNWPADHVKARKAPVSVTRRVTLLTAHGVCGVRGTQRRR